MTTEATETETPIGPPDGPPMAIAPAVVEIYSSWLAAVPDAGGDGMDGILAALAMATDPADLDAPWRSAGLELVVNVPLRITGIRKLPSDYPGGLPYFLVIDGAVTETGETISITTGSVSVVAQLVKAHALGAFPLNVIPRKAERASKAGYYPMHLEIGRR